MAGFANKKVLFSLLVVLGLVLAASAQDYHEEDYEVSPEVFEEDFDSYADDLSYDEADEDYDMEAYSPDDYDYPIGDHDMEDGMAMYDSQGRQLFWKKLDFLGVFHDKKKEAARIKAEKKKKREAKKAKKEAEATKKVEEEAKPAATPAATEGEAEADEWEYVDYKEDF